MWRDGQGVERAFRLTPIGTRRLSGIATRSAALYRRLDLWRRETAQASAASAEMPPTAEITSMAPRELVKARFYARLPGLALIAGAMACGLVGAPFSPWRAMGFLEVWVTCCVTQMILTLPIARHREPARAAESAPERAAA
jgi:hypothetical protein